MKQNYEITFVLSNQNDTYSKGIEGIKSVFSEVGVEETNFKDLGVKTLFFPIRENLNNRLVVFYVRSEPDIVNTLSKKLRLKDEVYRFIIIALEERELQFLNKRDKRLKNSSPA